MNTENNKLIAEFMGLKPKCEMDGIYSFSDMPFFSIRENDIDKVIEGIAKYSKYHSDWNWLMKVVEKIESILPNDEVVKIEYKDCRIAFGDEIYVSENAGTKIQAVYNACVEFVKWQNQQQK